MKNSVAIAIFSFLKQETKLIINAIKFPYNFVKEFSFLRFLCYLINNSIIPNRDKIFRSYILKNTQKWKFRKEAINKNANKYILITNMINHLGYTMSDIIVGKNLMEIFRSDGVGLIRTNDLKTKLIFKSFGIKKFIILNDVNFFMRMKYFLKAYSIIKSCKTMDVFIKFTLNDVKIGQSVYDHYLRFTGVGTTNHFDHRFYLFLFQALSTYYQLKKNYDKFKFIACVLTERQFIPGNIIYQSSLINRTSVYSRVGLSNTFSVRKYSNTSEMWKTRERFSNKLYDQISNSIKEKAVKIGGNNIEKRFKGIYQYAALHEYFEEHANFQKIKKNKKNEKKTVTKKELCEKLEWDQTKPIVAILSSDFTDGVFDHSWSLFRDRLTWFRETLHKAKDIPNINWLVKSHPNDEKYRYVTNAIFEYKKICSNYKHILPFPNDVSIASIPKFVHAVLSLAGSPSYEYPCFGIPVVQACESVCSGKGFTIDPGSKKEYFEILHKIGKINKLNKHQIDKAKIYSFIIQNLTRINVNLVAPHEGSRINDKNFWPTMITLVNNYKEEEDSLKKMMKIQEKNNDRHTINYNLLK